MGNIQWIYIVAFEFERNDLSLTALLASTPIAGSKFIVIDGRHLNIIEIWKNVKT